MIHESKYRYKLDFKSKNVVNHKLSLYYFFKHFSDFGNDIFQNVNTESENVASTNKRYQSKKQEIFGAKVK